MSQVRPHWICLLACGGALCIVSKPAAAQTNESAGLVRISDSAPCPQPGAGTTWQGDYGYSNCPPDGYGTQPYGWGGHHHRGPRYHFYPPVKRPIYRSPVSYTKGFSDAWTGVATETGPAYRAPVVYMPTDTTQLGYYYQVVPYWQPKPGAVPPPPLPEAWHTNIAQIPAFSRHPAGLIYGTAPTAIPPQAPVPWGSEGIVPPAPSGEPCPTPVQKTNGVTESRGLEKTTDSPELLPIQ